MKRLIVSADDFGLTPSINQGIAMAFREGIVTSINYIPTGEACDGAAMLIKDLRLPGIGAHLALTETIPLLTRKDIPTLIKKNGRFPTHYYTFFARFFAGMISRDEIYRELSAQLERTMALGVPVTNLSSHEHIHMMPDILDIFIRLAHEYKVPYIRYPHNDRSPRASCPVEMVKSAFLSAFGSKMAGRLDTAGVHYADHFFGLLDSGNITEDVLIRCARSLRDGVTEIVCHPGFLGPEVLDRYRFHLKTEHELSALTSLRVRKAFVENGVIFAAFDTVHTHA